MQLECYHSFWIANDSKLYDVTTNNSQTVTTGAIKINKQIKQTAGYAKYLWQIITETSSSAVTERPHEASCLSVVSSNSTICRAQSFLVTSASHLPMCSIKFCSDIICLAPRYVLPSYGDRRVWVRGQGWLNHCVRLQRHML